MKKFLALIVVVACLAPAQTVRKVRKYELYVGGGMSLPYSPLSFNTNWKPGFTVHGGFGFTLSTRMSLIVSGDYSSHEVNTSATQGQPMVTLGGLVNLKMQLNPTAASRSFYPYAIIGLGAANTNFGATTGVAAREETVVALTGGAGADIKLNPTTYIFLEGAYLMALTSKNSTASLPVRAGMKFRL